jgi:hypothetical protein
MANLIKFDLQGLTELFDRLESKIDDHAQRLATQDLSKTAEEAKFRLLQSDLTLKAKEMNELRLEGVRQHE